MLSNPVQELYDRDKGRRIVISLREDGTYFYEEEYFSQHEHEMCWVPKKKHSIGFYDSHDTVLREAIANTDWLRDDLAAG